MNLRDEPGRNWRWLAWLGAVLALLAVFLPFERMSIWKAKDQIFELAWQQDTQKGFFVVAFCCLAAPLLGTGAIFSAICLRNGTVPTAHIRRSLVILLWAVTAIAPYVFIFRHFPTRSPENDLSIALGMAGLSVYLLLNGLAFLRGKRERYTPMAIFSIGLVPICLTALAWCAIDAALIQYYYFGRSGRTDVMTCVTSSIGTVGSLMLLAGWLAWWRAVGRDYRSREPVVRAATVQAVPAEG